MSEQSGSDLTIRVDTNYYRFTVHRQTLKAIGDPLFIHWGYQPRTKTLMLFGTWINEGKAVRVRLNKKGSCYVFSKGLIEGIRRVSNVLTESGSYLLLGRLQGDLPAVVFPLKEAQIVSRISDYREELSAKEGEYKIQH